MSDEGTGAVEQVRRQWRQRLLIVVATGFLLLIATVGLGWTLANRVQDVAPGVIEEIATERREAFESRLLARSNEARVLATEMLTFLQRLWQENDSLHQIRSDVHGATTQLRILTGEVTAALDSPTRHVGTLLENGPTRARAILDHALAVAAELQRLIPAIVGALERAEASVRDDERSALAAVMTGLGVLLEPMIGKNASLESEWRRLEQGIFAWVGRVEADFATARKEMSGDELSGEFMRRLLERAF